MTNVILEQLHETVLELKRVKEREKKFKDENSAILSAISAMAGAENKIEVFNSLLKVIKRYVLFENALVLTRNKDTQDKFSCLVSTNPIFDHYLWPNGNTLQRCVLGKTVILYAPEKVHEFKQLQAQALAVCRSALITGVQVNTSESVLMLFSSAKGGFAYNAQQVMERFRPMIERTIIDIDYREHLQALVAVKTLELNQSRQRFRDLAKTASDWFWEVNDKLEITYFNAPGMANIMVDAAVILHHLDQQPSIKTTLLEFMLQKKAFSELEWCIVHHGRELWISLSGRPFYDKKNNVCLGFRGTGKDITQRKQQFQELQQARKQAEAANAAKSQFLAMMSHEIRTPLNAVMGLLEALSQSQLKSEQYLWVQQMDKSAQLLLTIINDVLDLSRIESDKFKLSPENINPRDAVTVVFNQLNEVVARKNLHLIADISPTVPSEIYQDGNRFTQILLNLVGNAVKFTESGSVTVIMRANCAQKWLELEVQDTGIGIAPESRDNIFQPFTQADGSITRKYGGTGLGLSICKKLLTQMQGEIDFHSTPGVGTTFQIKLPYLDPIAAPQPPSQEQGVTRALHILVAEDSKANQMVVKLMLEKAGHQVAIANNGVEAIALITQLGPELDLVLMDMSMPILCGIESTMQLRAKGVTLPIIALTANAMGEDKERCLAAGMDDFITKPIRAAVLNQMIAKYAHQQ